MSRPVPSPSRERDYPAGLAEIIADGHLVIGEPDTVPA